MANRFSQYLDTILNPGGISFFPKRGIFDFIEGEIEQGDLSIIKAIIGNTYDASKVYVLYGCGISTSGGATIVDAGAVFAEGEIFTSDGNSFTTPTGGNVVVLNLTQTSWQPTDAIGNHYADPQEFTGSSNANIHIYRTCDFASGASGSGTITNTSASDYSNVIFLEFGRDNSYSSLTVSTAGGNGTVTGIIHYRKNYQANTMTIYGLLTSSTPSDFADFPSTLYYDMGITFPTGYIPSIFTQYFTAYYFTGGAIKNFADTQFMNQFRCGINSAGKLLINWIKPDVAISGYAINISATISLD